jgi:hypothetical protein
MSYIETFDVIAPLATEAVDVGRHS